MHRRSPLRDAPDELLDWIRARRAAGWGAQRIFDERRDDFDLLGANFKSLQNCLAHGFLSEQVTAGSAAEHLGKIADLLARSGITPEDVGKVQAVKLSEWQSLTKDADGEAQIHDLAGASIVLTPHWADGPEWPVVQPAAPTVIRAGKVAARKVATPDGWQTALILPDVQFGYLRDVDTGELIPFHDEAALEVVLQAVRLVRPDLVVFLGDLLDLPEWSRFDQEPEFAYTTQATLDTCHLYLAKVRAEVPDARIVILEGNHDRRIAKSILANAKAALRLRPAATPPDHWPVLSVPALLRLDDLGCEYVGGFPAGIFWISERLACVHGEKVRSNASTAAAVVDDERVSVIFGHVHRIEQRYKTRRTFHGARSNFAATPGCLCRIDGTVPSTKGSTDPFGKPISRPEDWQQGFAMVTFQPGDGPFALEQVFINDGTALFRGVPLNANTDEVAA